MNSCFHTLFKPLTQVDLDVIKKLDATFDDFRIFVKITEKLRNAQALLRKDAEDFDWENL